MSSNLVRSKTIKQVRQGQDSITESPPSVGQMDENCPFTECFLKNHNRLKLLSNPFTFPKCHVATFTVLTYNL